MKTFLALVCIICSSPLSRSQSGPTGLSQTGHRPYTKADVEGVMTELANWGRWGKDDQLGTLNLITPAKRKQAAALVRDGIVVSLSHDALTEKSEDNASPFVQTMTALPRSDQETGFSMDSYSVSYHGIAHTHLDALCHGFFQGKIYNGFSASEISAQGGCPKASIITVKSGILTRGVLIDVAALKGVDYLEPGTPIYPEDLEAWEKKAKVRVSSGDAVFIRAGRWARRAAKGPVRNYAGLHASAAKWLHDRDVAILGSDGAQDVRPSGIDDVALPIHDLALVGMGLYLIDNCDLEDLAKEAAKHKRWEFMLTAAPIAVRGGTGSPINPMATF